MEEAGDKFSKRILPKPNNINQWEAKINCLEAGNLKLSQLLDPKVFMGNISQDVSSSLKTNQAGKKIITSSRTSGFVSELYIGKPFMS